MEMDWRHRIALSKLSEGCTTVRMAASFPFMHEQPDKKAFLSRTPKLEARAAAEST